MKRSWIKLALLVTVLAIQGLWALPAFAKPCWCRIRTSCTGTIIKTYDPPVADYPWYVSNKKGKCGKACSEAASADQGSAELAAAICGQLGPGSHTVQAFSVVGDKDNQNNTCDVDQTLGPVTCSQKCSCPKGDCSCPEGYDLKGELCLGTCPPPGAGPLSIVDGQVAFPAECQTLFQVAGTQCKGPCVSCGNGLCGIPDGVSGVSVSGGTVKFPADCVSQASWN